MANTLFTGKVYHRFDELPSTNDWAAELLTRPSSGSVQGGAAKSKPPEGTVVRADSQSAGRGQFGSRWVSEPGKNLTLSVILYPTWLEVQAQFYLSMAVALAVKDVVGGGVVRGEGVKLKWPNDLYLASQKTAGILIQNIISGQHLQASIVGIGLNVNQIEFDLALSNPTSLALFFGKNFDLDEVAEHLFECLERRYLQLKSGQRAAIKAEYEHSLFRLGETSRFVRSADGSEFTGIIRGVTEAGRLRVETKREGLSAQELLPGEEIFEVKEVRMLI